MMNDLDTYTWSKDNAIKELQIVPEYVKESKGDPHADSAGALIVREVLMLMVRLKNSDVRAPEWCA